MDTILGNRTPVTGHSVAAQPSGVGRFACMPMEETP
jgi:hypothetical protein